MNSVISVFFGKELENEININLLENDYMFPAKRITEYIKKHYKDMYFTILGYQLFLCIITFSPVNIKIFVAMVFILSVYVIISNWKSNSKND